MDTNSPERKKHFFISHGDEKIFTVKNFQSNLLQAIFSKEEQPGFDQKGLSAYRRNLQANACRALSISYPVVFQLIGEELFNSLSKKYVQERPPESGDWAEWGRDFPEWLQSTEIGKAIPYLGDSAGLDWIQHTLERFENPVLDFQSFQRLAEPNAEAGKIILNPTATLRSFDFPVVDIWLAHNGPEKQRAGSMEAARNKIQAGTKQTALVWRKHWQVHIKEINSSEQAWLEEIQGNSSLGDALNKVSQLAPDEEFPSFQFDQWLPVAIEDHLVIGFEALIQYRAQ